MPRGVCINEQAETLDKICGELEVFQAERGYRFGLETLLLTGFVQAGVDSMLDLGTGSGIMPLVLTKFGKVAHATGVEIQAALVERAQRSVAYNDLSDKIQVMEADLCKLSDKIKPSQFDLVISNPPYGRPGTGKQNPNSEKALARHEIRCHLRDVVEAAAYAVKVRGKFNVVVPPLRLTELIKLCEEFDLRPARMRMVHGRKELSAKHCLFEAIRGGRMDLVIESPLIVYENTNEYTTKLKEILYPKFSSESHVAQ
jgi:tRNA1Val (adenine37-N6)-methyltransferase